MKTKFFIITLMFALLASCKHEEELPGISGETTSKNDVVGGWMAKSINCIINTSMGNFQDNVQKSLEDKLMSSALYITQDSIFYIEQHHRGYYYVKKSSAYHVEENPSRIFVDNKYLICDQYAPYYLIKKEKEKFCLYLTKEEAMEMLRNDSEFKDNMSLLEKLIKDAQFEFYYEPTQLEIFQQIDNGDFVHTEGYSVY